MLLETEWVPRGVFRFSPARVAERLAAFAGLPNVTLENPSVARGALEWTAKGMDFADALHLAAAKDRDVFFSFDRALARKARRVVGVVVESP